MKKKNGFTLIELLAVIVILAIIALIATPLVMKTLHQAKLNAAEDTTYGIVDVAENYIAENILSNSGDFSNVDLEFECNGEKCSLTENSKRKLDAEGLNYNENLNIKGKIPKNGTIIISEGGKKVTGSTLNISGFTCYYANNKASCTEEKNTEILKSFEKQDWTTIIANIRTGKTENYHVGDTKLIELDTNKNGKKEKYSLRIANMSTPEECNDPNFSETACGFVIEFGGSQDLKDKILKSNISINAPTYLEYATATSSATASSGSENNDQQYEIASSTATIFVDDSTNPISDIIASRRYNPSNKNSEPTNGYGSTGGWEYSELRKYLNYSIYNMLPDELKEGIIETRAISASGYNDEHTFITKDYLYLFAPKEIWGEGTFTYESCYFVYPNRKCNDYTFTVDSMDDVFEFNRQLDYYKNANVTPEHYENAKKYYNGHTYFWWLRSPRKNYDPFFLMVYHDGGTGAGSLYGNYSDRDAGVSPAFRIG